MKVPQIIHVLKKINFNRIKIHKRNSSSYESVKDNNSKSKYKNYISKDKKINNLNKKK